MSPCRPHQSQKQIGRTCAGFATAPSPVTAVPCGCCALATHAGVCPGGTGSHRLILGSDAGLADALAGAGFDLEAAASGRDHDIMTALGGLLTRAQRAGTIRDDIQIADVKALLEGCLVRERDAADPLARDRTIAVISGGLRPS